MGGSRLAIDGKTPAQVVADFSSRGITVSERTLRQRARAIGACRMLGNAMILLPEHIDLIFEEPECHSTSIAEGASIGAEDILRTVTSTSEKALAHLMKLSQPQRSAKSRPPRANVVSLDRTPRSRKTI